MCAGVGTGSLPTARVGMGLIADTGDLREARQGPHLREPHRPCKVLHFISELQLQWSDRGAVQARVDWASGRGRETLTSVSVGGGAPRSEG